MKKLDPTYSFGYSSSQYRHLKYDEAKENINKHQFLKIIFFLKAKFFFLHYVDFFILHQKHTIYFAKKKSTP